MTSIPRMLIESRRRVPRMRVHPTVMREVRRICRRYDLGEDYQTLSKVVTEVLRRLRHGIAF